MHYSYKSNSLKIKDVDTQTGIVSGYFAAFGMEDSDGDIIQKGAFSKTIQERGPKATHPRIKHLLDHNTTKAIGVLQDLYEDEYGLAYVSKLALNTTIGRDTLGMYQDGIITEHSVGFRTVNAKSDSDGVNILTELMLWEGSSLQAWGANQFTPVTGVKSLTKDQASILFDRMDKLTKAMRGSYSDETMELFEIEYNQVKQAIKDSLPEPEPDKPTLAPEPTPDYAADLILTFRKSLKLN